MRKARGDLTQGSLLKHLLRLAGPIILSYILQDAFNIIDMIFVRQTRCGCDRCCGCERKFAPTHRCFFARYLDRCWDHGRAVFRCEGPCPSRTHRDTINPVSRLLFHLCHACRLPTGETGIACRPNEGPRSLEARYNLHAHRPHRHQYNVFVNDPGFHFPRRWRRVHTDARADFSTVINIVLDPLLIFGLWGFPKLGVAGSAYATLIGRGVGVIVLLYLCWTGSAPISLKSVQFRVDFTEMLAILRLGVYSSMQGFWRHASRLGFLWVIGPYGKTVVAAYTICMRLRILVMNPGFGIANSVAPLVGQNLGANQVDRAERSARVANILGAAIMAVIGAIFLVFPETFIRIFTADTGVVEIGIVYLRFLAPTFGFIGFSLVLGKALNGAGDTFSPMVITLGSQLVVGLGLVIILSHLIGLNGVWIGIALSNIVQGCAMWLWYHTGRWKSIKIVKRS